MKEQKTLISFDNVSFRDKQVLANELANILSKSADLQNELLKERPNTQDAGTIIAVILGAPAVVAVSKGIVNWLIKHREVKLTFKKGDSEFHVENISSNDLDTIINGLHSLVKDNE
ncbi:hypothetical protein IMCC3317_04810 [Kordia antarctica]|uniref:Uncharacterized protein n=1 Tax=Kordia antarctica TaxID=1218801 RepID=A0A7L4ZEV3_9FLAO|nr:hypothetical protein [Kordia antarctica]QHI35135.1 hypothetical protein IMCC3317_04810 [Kordia antarctica]